MYYGLFLFFLNSNFNLSAIPTKASKIVFFHWVGKNNHIPHTWESSKLRRSKLRALSERCKLLRELLAVSQGFAVKPAANLPNLMSSVQRVGETREK